MAPTPSRQELSCKPLVIFILALLCPFFFLAAQENRDSTERNTLIKDLDNGKYSVMEYSGDSLLLFRGYLSSLDPDIRDGKFYFFDSIGRISAIGMYRNDIPIDSWTYYDTLMKPVEVFDYNSVLQSIRADASFSSVDPLANEKLPSRFGKYISDDGTFQIVDEMPTFQDQEFESSFGSYFFRQMHLPAYADALNLDGNVQISFIIDSEGRVRKPKINSSSLTDFNMEALRVLVESRGWQAAKLKGFPVSTLIAMNLVFHDPDIDNRYHIVDEMPRFEGQDPINSFRYFIGRKLRYPIEAGRAGIQGRVIVHFTVMRDGSLGEIKVVRSIHPSLDFEAKRVIGLSPKWTPGKHEGKLVKVLYTFPVNFVLR